MKNYRFIALVLAAGALIVGAYVYIKNNEVSVPQEPRITSLEAARTHAENWIKTKAPTYVYDGSDLISIDTRVLDCENCFSSTFMFTSSHSGLGNRENMMTLQMITQHIVEVTYKNGLLFSVITDGTFDEILGKDPNQKEYMSVVAYFGSSVENPNSADCTQVYPLERIVEMEKPPYEVAIRLLLQGPSDKEKKDGYYTSLNKDVTLKSLSLKGDVAYVEFDAALNKGVAGSCRVAAIRSEITKTLQQFPAIKDVVISVDGRTDDILQP